MSRRGPRVTCDMSATVTNPAEHKFQVVNAVPLGRTGSYNEQQFTNMLLVIETFTQKGIRHAHVAVVLNLR